MIVLRFGFVLLVWLMGLGLLVEANASNAPGYMTLCFPTQHEVEMVRFHIGAATPVDAEYAEGVLRVWTNDQGHSVLIFNPRDETRGCLVTISKIGKGT